MNKLATLHLPISMDFPIGEIRLPSHRMRTPPSQSDQQLLDYWRRRSQGLNESEWHDFYRLAVPVLMATQLPPEFSDGTARRNLVDIFFAEKIFLNAGATRAGPLENVHALHIFLKRFVVDIQRRSAPYVATEDFTEDADQSDKNARTAPAAYEHILAEAGIDLREASISAGVFLSDLDGGEAAYLRHHSCAENEDKESISGIAERLALGSSYHYKAKGLGITRGKGETYVGYEKTKIGRWLLSVGAKLNEEWQEEIAILLTLLCLKVYESREDQA